MATQKQIAYVEMLEDKAGIMASKDISNLTNHEISEYIEELEDLISVIYESQIGDAGDRY